MAPPDPSEDSLRPNLSGLNSRALMATALHSEMQDIPWPAGFERKQLLGTGGMGEVHLAHDISLGRDVAVKIVHPDFTEEPIFIERLEREARLMSAISHPGIVAIHRLERLAGEGAAIIMEHIDGGNLRQWMRQHTDGIPIADALQIIKEIATAMHAAHSRNIIHRDLKPENILLTSDGHAKVTDFGLAAPLAAHASRLTLNGTTAGTADYMAPERYLSSDIDPRSDVYSLGVILYELLTGILPRGNFDPPHAIRKDLKRSISDATMRALKAEPAQRFATMAEFATALENRRSKRTPLLVIACISIIAAMAYPFLPLGKTTPPTTQNDSITEWKHFLPLADSSQQTLSGGWRNDNGNVLSDNQICILKLADEMPPAYEVRMTFTRLEGVHSVALFFQTPGGTASIDIDGWGKGLAGVQSIDGRDLRQGNAFPFSLQNDRTYELTAHIRPDRISISLDGIHKITTSIEESTLSIVSPWAWNPRDTPAALAIGSFQSPTRFSAIEWRAISEKSLTE